MTAATPKHAPAGAALTALIVELFRLNGGLLAAGDALTAPFGQTSARWQVLGAIVDGPKTVSAAARHMGLTRQAVQRLANLLVEDGICQQLPNPEHRRAPLLTCTLKGERVLAQITRAQTNWVNQLGSGMSPQDLGRTVALLRRLRERLETASDGRR